MTDAIDTFTPDSPGRRVSDFLPKTHRDLPTLRLFLPFLDEQENPVRWSSVAPVDDDVRQWSWAEFSDRSALERDVLDRLEPTAGVLDRDTAAALAEVVGRKSMVGLRWTGYQNDDAPRTRVNGDDYFLSPLSVSDLQAGKRLPEFAWDSEGTLAWGARLFPDSIVVAAALPLFRQLFADERVDVVSVREHDLMPWSAGD